MGSRHSHSPTLFTQTFKHTHTHTNSRFIGFHVAEFVQSHPRKKIHESKGPRLSMVQKPRSRAAMSGRLCVSNDPGASFSPFRLSTSAFLSPTIRNATDYLVQFCMFCLAILSFSISPLSPCPAFPSAFDKQCIRFSAATTFFFVFSSCLLSNLAPNLQITFAFESQTTLVLLSYGPIS